MNVYEIVMESYEVEKGKKRGEWAKDEAIHVLANGDARKAVVKAERHLIGQVRSWEDDCGRKRVNVVRKVRLLSVERTLSIDVS